MVGDPGNAANRARLLVLFVAVLLVAALAAGSGARGGEEARAAEKDAPPSALLPDRDELSAALADAHRSYLEELSRREEELAGPQAAAERERSREAYADLTPSEAQQLALSIFAETFEELDRDPARFLSDARLDKVVEADAATVTSEGNTQLLEAGIPVRAKDEDGELGKVDLSVVPADGGWELENPLVEVEVGGSVEEGITLPESGVTVTQAGVADSAARPVGDADLFFADVGEGTDTDLIVSPTSTGVELFDVLRSPESPESLRFQLQIPSGSQLRPGPAGGAEVVIDGKVRVYVPKPWAHDAQGTAVPVEMTVDGGSLVLTLEHREQDLAYPILVDPTIYQDWGWWYAGSNLQGLSAFYFQTSGGGWWAHGTYADPGGFPGYDGKGLFVWSDPGNLGSDQWGQWVRPQPNAGSYLAAATINPFWRYDNPCNDPTRDYQPYDYEGMWNGSGWNELRFNDAKNYGYTNLPTWGTALVFGLSTDWRGRNSPCYRHLMAGGVGIWLDDWQSPTVSITALPTGWIKKDSTARSLSVSAGDAGLGVQSVSMTSPSSIGWNQAWCSGTYDNRCLESRSGTIGFTTSSFAEGAVNVAVSVSDPTGKGGSTNGTVYVDGTAPGLTLSGSSTPSTYELQIDAKDGGPGELRSGVKEVKVYLDGVLKQTKAGSCSTSGCGATLSFKYTQSLVGLSQGQHTLEVVATDQVGYTKTSSTTFKLEAPDTVIDSGPEGVTKQSGPTFTYHSTMAGSTFSCAIDGGAYVSCPSGGYATPKLADGSHTFSVRATSGAGITDASPASRSFTVDTTPPETTIEYGPSGATTDRTPAFGYSSDDPDARFECKLDASAYEICGAQFKPDSPLADGAHSFTVRAFDRAGNVDPTPASSSFNVDATPPTVQIQTGPEGPTKNVLPTFTFTSSGATALNCAIDAEADEGESPSYGPCTSSTSHSPLLPLADGTYTFRVRASDEAGNADVDTRGFTVDSVAPDTSIDSGPSGTTDEDKPTFAFSSSEASSNFQCRFDAQAFAPCSGPGATHTPASALADGPHTFEVRAFDAAGNVDPTPALRLFTVSTGGPQTTITAGPEGAIGQTSATFKYTADEPATFQCRLDAAPFAPCPAGETTLPLLTEGEHVFEVRAVNGAAVVDPTPARRAFVVDTTAPAIPQTSGPVREPNVPGLTLRIEATDGDSSAPATTRSGVQSLLIFADGQLVETLEARCAAKRCSPLMVRTAQLPHPKVIGSHSYEVKARDGVGNVSPPASWSEETPKLKTLLDREATATTSASCGSGTTNTIRATKGERVVRGSSQSDLIISAPGVNTIKAFAGCDVILGGPSQEVILGGADDDTIRGGRSDDRIRGQAGDDRLYGGVGDDPIFGEGGNDIVDGGPGADRVKGEAGNDFVRGGQGEDELLGGPDTDTLSYADALAPGFIEISAQRQKAEKQGISGFPDIDESGVYINFKEQPARAYDGEAANGGGTDKLPGNDQGNFERIVGSPFSDWIEGSSGVTQIDAGRGADLIRDVGSASVNPGPGGDSVKGTPPGITPRPESTTIQIGIQEPTAGLQETNVYLAGGKASDSIAVKVTPGTVKFTARNKATKDNFETLGTLCNNVKGTWTVSCKLDARLGALVVHGGKGNDRLTMASETERKPGSISLDGGPGVDRLFGLGMEELFVDGGPQGGGEEVLHGGDGDDAIFQSDGGDEVAGDGGSDLIVSTRVCGGDKLYGDKEGGQDTGADNAQFAQLEESGVFVDLEDNKVGKVGKSIDKCGSLRAFNDAEGSRQRDVMYGTNGPNLLIGRDGKDSLFGRGKRDKLNGNDNELDEKIDCGGQQGDTAIVDAIDKKKHAVLPRDCPKIRTARGKKQGRISLSAATLSEPPVLGEVSEEPETAALISYFALDEVAGTSAENDVEGGKPGTYKAAGFGPSVNGPGPTLGVPGGLGGEEGTAVKLDGSDDYVDLEGQALPAESADGTYSIAMFAKFERNPGQVEYLFASGEGGEGVFLYRAADGRLVFASGLEPGAPKVIAPDPVSDQAWHQVVGTLEGETITLNVDGFPYRLGYGSSVLPIPGAAQQSWIGGRPGGNQYLAASVDEVVFYEGALTEAAALQQLAESEAEEPALMLAPPPETADADGDGVMDGADNCPATANADQADVNDDGIGDACEPPDGDGDEVADADDNCPSEYNPEQQDANGDGLGDECAGMPPEASTVPATNVKGTTATFNATVDPEATATSYRFEYGTTASYGSLSPLFPKSAGTGADPVAVSQAVSGLQQGTTYHYRIVAWSEFGESEGEDATFVTLKAPAVVTKQATAVQAVSAGLNGTVNPEGEATSYQFEYGKTTSYGSKAPIAAKAVGSGTSSVEVSEAVTGLEPNTTYHYRLVASNGAGTTNGADVVFKTAATAVTGTQLGSMPVTEPFNGSSTSVADFGAKWTALGWAAGSPAKGANSSSGWGPVPAFPTVNGAYYNPTLTDTGAGLAAVATLAGNPTISERYFSVWLDMPAPGVATKAGYQLRFTEVAPSSYDVALAKWSGGTQTLLATKAAYSLPVGSSFAIVDQGSTVSAWTNTGSGFGQLLSASDSTYAGGNAGIEGAGNILRLSNFRVGVPLSAVANMNGALAALALTDSFQTSESPLSGGGSWAALQWDNSTSSHNTGQVSGGWGPYDAFSTINGAFWQPASYADTGTGTAVAATLTGNPTISERYFSLWLDMPAPQSARSGYELRFTETSPSVYTATLSRWQAGTKTTLATKVSYSLPLNSQFALAAKGGTVSAWVSGGTEFVQILSAADATFASGYTGIEGAGNITRLTNFRSGPLPPF